MAAISGKVYLFIGVFMIVATWLLGLKTDMTRFIVFLVVGGVFILIGLFKILSQRAKEPVKPKSGSRTHHHPAHTAHHTGHASHTSHSGSHHSTHRYKYCHYCGLRSHTVDSFCRRCGSRL